MVGEVSEGREVYVGLFRDPWEWSDQTESSLRFWRPTQTVNTAFTDNCVALLRAESGHWGDMECSIERPFLCSYGEYRHNRTNQNADMTSNDFSVSQP